MAYTAADVKKLRELTQAGMMDCKKALDETDGDFGKAVELLRVKGAAKAAARAAEREASAGLVAASGNALISLKAETDFVAKNEAFINAAQQIAEAADAHKVADAEALKAVSLGESTVGETVEELARTIGEKIELGEVAYFDGSTTVYLHKKASDLPPTLGVLVALLAGFLCLGTSALAPILWVSLATLAIAAIAKAKIGGQTGDVLGSAQQLCEIAALGALVAVST